MDNRPIGIFDSGIGGLTVWREVVKQFPEESMVYYADSGRCPYGPRPGSEIRDFSTEITRFLLETHNVKMVVVACNTATAAAIAHLRAAFSVPFVGMEPALKPAAAHSKSKTIGILATAGTFRGKHFQETRDRYAHACNVLLQVGEGLVQLVERGETEGPEAEHLLHTYLDPMLEAGADQIVLGCTHYPFLQKTMNGIVGDRAAIIDPAPAVARQVGRLLEAHDLAAVTGNAPLYTFYTSGDEPHFRQLVQQLCPEIGHLEARYSGVEIA